MISRFPTTSEAALLTLLAAAGALALTMSSWWRKKKKKRVWRKVGTVDSLYVYPLKSGRPEKVEEAKFTIRGPGRCS